MEVQGEMCGCVGVRVCVPVVDTLMLVNVSTFRGAVFVREAVCGVCVWACVVSRDAYLCGCVWGHMCMLVGHVQACVHLSGRREQCCEGLGMCVASERPPPTGLLGVHPGQRG